MGGQAGLEGLVQRSSVFMLGFFIVVLCLPLSDCVCVSFMSGFKAGILIGQNIPDLVS